MITTLRYWQRLVVNQSRRAFVFRALYRKYKDFTMVPEEYYVNNLDVIQQLRGVPGCVIECGTWRGGMIAGIAEVLGPDRHYYLFDSYEGLPPAQDVDGRAAKAYQANPDGECYFDNCTADEATARRAMAISGVPHVTVTKGWFEHTLPGFRPSAPIALLRLDADWFDSTLTCLEGLYSHMSPEGLILLDDYYTWDGCSRAVHHFLASHGYAARVMQPKGLCAIRPNLDSALPREFTLLDHETRELASAERP
jgi:O-methyltransferase